MLATVHPRRLRRRFPRSALLLSVLFSLQCGLSEFVDQLTVTFTIEPVDVPSGGAFQARLIIANPTFSAVTLPSTYDCAAFLSTVRGDEEVVVEGTQFYCPGAFVSFTIPANGELVRTYDLVARVRSPSDPPSAYAAALDEAERERIATQYAELFVGQIGFFQMLKGQLSPWDFLWFALAVATAFKMMSVAPAPKAPTEAG